MTNPLDIKFFEGAMGAILGSLATMLCFKTKLRELEKDHDEFRKETLSMFREIREDVKTLLGSRRNDLNLISKIIRDRDE